MNRHLLILLAAFQMVTLGYSARAVPIDWPNIEYREELADPVAPKDAPLFLSQESKTLNHYTTLGYHSHPIWLKVSPEGFTPRPSSEHLFVPPSPWIVSITFYQEGKTESALHTRETAFPILTLDGFDFSKPFYVRIDAPFLVSLDADWFTPQETIAQAAKLITVNGFYLGATILLIVYHLMLYFTLRRRVFIMYIGFALSMSLISATASGLIDYYTHDPFIWREVSVYLRPLPGIMMALFTIELFSLKGRQLLIAQSIIAFNALATLLVWAMGAKALIYSDAGNGYSLVGHLVIAVHQSRKKTIGANAFLLGILSLTVFITIWTLGLKGIIPRSLFVIQAPLIGNLLEISFLTFALSRSLEKLRDIEVNAQIEASKVETLNRFLRLLTHDLTNPLAVIEGSIPALTNKSPESMSSESPDLKSRAISRIQRASNQIRLLLGNVKTLQALQSGKLHIKSNPTSISQALDEALFLVSDLSTKKQIEIKTPDDSEFNKKMVLAELHSLTHEVFCNLLTNAIKFSPQGAKIQISWAPLNESIKIQIKDEGIGIPPELLVKLFDDQAQTSRSGTAGESGTGFGMPLVKSFIDAYGGKIHIDSTVNVGTTVTLELKLA